VPLLDKNQQVVARDNANEVSFGVQDRECVMLSKDSSAHVFEAADILQGHEILAHQVLG
jgi:hypothetical protein